MLTTSTPNTLSHAFKEWAVAVKALEIGKTIMLLRKGGIHEVDGRFTVAHEKVVLYPTYEHQKPSLLKSEYADGVCQLSSVEYQEIDKNIKNIKNMSQISSWAEITDIFVVHDELKVKALLKFHIWNEHFISDRLKWKPRQPLYILLLRAYKLPKIQEIPNFPEYNGCKSWIDLTQEIDLRGSELALPQTTYNQKVTEIRAVLSEYINQ
jgi:hypothetical protein